MDLIAVQNQFLMFYPISNLRPLLAYFNFINGKVVEISLIND